MSRPGVGLACQRQLEMLAIWGYFKGSGTLSPLPPMAMTTFGTKSHKNITKHHDSADSNHPSANQYNTIHSDKQNCKSHNTSDQVNEITGQTMYI